MENLRITGFTNNGGLKELQNPIRMEIIKSFDSPAVSLEVELGHTQRLFDLLTITVQAGSQLLFNGYVDEQILTEAEHSTLLVRARSAGGLLLDNEALPQYYYMPHLSDIFRKHIMPYGFRSIRGPGAAGGNMRMSEFLIPKGLSEWEVFDLFCRRTLGHTPFIRDDVVCVHPFRIYNKHRVSNQSKDVNDIPFLSISYIQRRSAVISAIIMRGPTGVYDTMLDNPINSRTKSRRKRYLIPPNEYVYNPLRDADQRMAKSALAYMSYKIVMPGFQPIAIMDVINADHPYMRVPNYFVAEVRYHLSTAGCTTTVIAADSRYLS